MSNLPSVLRILHSPIFQIPPWMAYLHSKMKLSKHKRRYLLGVRIKIPAFRDNSCSIRSSRFALSILPAGIESGLDDSNFQWGLTGHALYNVLMGVSFSINVVITVRFTSNAFDSVN